MSSTFCILEHLLMMAQILITNIGAFVSIIILFCYSYFHHYFALVCIHDK